MSISKVERAERRLYNLTRTAGVSDDGYNWLETALDPFHDKAVQLKGYPDTTDAASVVQNVKQSLTISCPAGITTGTWDCHIASLPMVAFGPTAANAQRVTLVKDSNNFVTGGVAIPATNTTTLPTYVGLTALSGPTGTNLDVGVALSSSITSQNLTLPSTYWNDSARVIGLGFEVHNITAELTVQGAVSVYRLPVAPYTNSSSSTLFQTGVSGVTAIPSSASTVSMPSIPSNEAQALLLYGTKTWLAKDGCYCVNTFNSMEISPNCSTTVQPLSYILTPNDTNQYIYPLTSVAGPPQLQVPASVFWANVNISGAYFTGLSLTTSLKINYNIIIERFPSPNGNDLAVMALPSPAFDPTALELYARANRELPVGCPVSENGFGDWFSGVVNTVVDTVSSVSKFAAPILSVIPQTKALGMGMTAYNEIKQQMDTAAAAPPKAPPITQALRARIGGSSPWEGGNVFGKSKRIPKAPPISAKLAQKYAKKPKQQLTASMLKSRANKIFKNRK